MKHLTLTMVLLLTVSGCATRSYTGAETRAMRFAVIGQTADFATTYYALEVDGGFEEGNSMFGDGDNQEVLTNVLLTKVALIGLGYVVGEIKPDARKAIWNTIGFFGAAPAAWNTYQVISN